MDTWICEHKKMQRTSKISYYNLFIPAEACGLQDGVILPCLASSTTTGSFRKYYYYYDDDNFKKQLMIKTTALHVHHVF